MSSVRMCDNCGVIFSEKELDWASAPVTRRSLNPRNGRVEEITEDEDRCPKCSGVRQHLIPQVAIEGLPNVQQ